MDDRVAECVRALHGGDADAVVELLSKRSSDADGAGMTVLHHLARVWDAIDPDVAERALGVLLEAGADVALRDGLGRCPSVVSAAHQTGFASALLAAHKDGGLSLPSDWLGRGPGGALADADGRGPTSRPAEAEPVPSHSEAQSAGAGTEPAGRQLEAGGGGPDERADGGGSGRASSQGEQRAEAVLRRGTLAAELLRERVRASGVGPAEAFAALAGSEEEGAVVTAESAASAATALRLDIEEEEAAVLVALMAGGADRQATADRLQASARQCDEQGRGVAAWLSSVGRAGGGAASLDSFARFCA